ncbi:uncharacterized protein LOC124915997 [Impatiens glandulifera]|uniref:uncharacterized protein LOC124915997 n=1 Tax=Impatiens glandulifera TaxID=253017 RepID=UPI001FB084BF|nr:uncharacterized protein LOC124915997 [Impatiens glandulifera]
MKTRQHARSISLPTRTNPLLAQFDENLSSLRGDEATSNSLSSLGDRLGKLQDLYVSVDDLIQMSHIQQLVQESNKKQADGVLDTYIRILDACTATKDIFSQAKHDVQELLSSIRRKKDTTDAHGNYLASRKKAKRPIQKALKDLKIVKISEGVDQVETIRLFNKVQSATISVLESSLCYVMGTKTHSSLVSKLMRSKSKDASKNEFDQMDQALDAQQLGEMELKIQDIEEGLDCLFKHLIKTRVLLLNLISY